MLLEESKRILAGLKCTPTKLLSTIFKLEDGGGGHSYNKLEAVTHVLFGQIKYVAILHAYA